MSTARCLLMLKKWHLCTLQAFLQRMMALCVASHYRNTPNDLILMSDAPAHHLFVLLGPVDESQVRLPTQCNYLPLDDVQDPTSIGLCTVRMIWRV